MQATEIKVVPANFKPAKGQNVSELTTLDDEPATVAGIAGGWSILKVDGGYKIAQTAARFGMVSLISEETFPGSAFKKTGCLYHNGRVYNRHALK